MKLLIRKHRRHIPKSGDYHSADISAANFSESLKPLTKDSAPDKIKKFSYIDIHGSRSESRKKKSKTKNISDMDLVTISKYINIGYYLVIPILVGVFLGVYIDSKFATKPRYTLVFLLLGTALTIYNLFNLSKKDNA